MKKNIKFIIMLLMLLPFNVFASGGISVSKSNLSISVGKSDTFKVAASNSAGKVTFSSSDKSICTVSQSSYWLDNDSVTVTVKGIKTGTCKITIGINAATYDNEVIKNTKTINVNVTKQKSSTNTLSNLTIDGKTIKNFSSSKMSYDLGTIDKDSITIQATPTDTKSKISGVGKKTINYGKNTFKVVVTAENGSKRSITISVSKKDPRSTDNSLKDLSVDFDSISFDKNVTYYSFKVEHNLDKITINGSANDTKAKVDGLGTFNLKNYVNEFKVKVTAENDTTKTYLIKVIRKDKDGSYGKLDSNSFLKSLTIENKDIKLDEGINNYDLLVDESVSELIIDAIPVSKTTNIQIEGNSNLKPGLNKVVINTIAEDDSKTIYTIDVYKKGEIKEDNSKNNSNIFLITTIVEAILLVCSIAYIIVSKRTK